MTSCSNPNCGNTIYSSCWEFNYALCLHFWFSHVLISHDPLSPSPFPDKVPGLDIFHFPSRWTFSSLTSCVPRETMDHISDLPWPPTCGWAQKRGLLQGLRKGGERLGYLLLQQSPLSFRQCGLVPPLKGKSQLLGDPPFPALFSGSVMSPASSQGRGRWWGSFVVTCSTMSRPGYHTISCRSQHPAHTFVNNPFTSLSSNYLIWMCHLFPARMLSDAIFENRNHI